MALDKDTKLNFEIVLWITQTNKGLHPEIRNCDRSLVILFKNTLATWKQRPLHLSKCTTEQAKRSSDTFSSEMSVKHSDLFHHIQKITHKNYMLIQYRLLAAYHTKQTLLSFRKYYASSVISQIRPRSTSVLFLDDAWIICLWVHSALCELLYLNVLFLNVTHIAWTYLYHG
jgi:hypothetical protein